MAESNVGPTRDRAPSLTPDSVTLGRHIQSAAFEVESVLRVGEQGYVLARRLEGLGPITVTPGSRLGGVPVTECLELPPALAPQPTRFEERMIFCLERIEDLHSFPEPRRVDLILGPAPTSGDQAAR